MSSSPLQRRYRLVDQQGLPHPELDEQFESMEEAWAFACHWWHNTGENEDSALGERPIGLGVEVSTDSGNWRTLRHPLG
jgi:hypothetical protein